MRNILSYEFGTQFTGFEILQWAKFQINNKTSHMKQGFHIIKRFSNIKPERMYIIQTSYPKDYHGKKSKNSLLFKV